MTDIRDRPAENSEATQKPQPEACINNTPDEYSLVDQVKARFAAADQAAETEAAAAHGKAAKTEATFPGSESDTAASESSPAACGTSCGSASAPPVADNAPGTPADGAKLLDELLAILTRYVVFPDALAAVAVALWVAATHAVEAWNAAPRLVLNSPQKRCGKTRALDVISGLCHAALITVNATATAIFRSIDAQRPPTLVIDEADAIFGTKRAAEQNEDFRALLNAGFQRNRPALRCAGPRHEPTEFATFAMVALAGIGVFPDTITDRALNVTMRRRTANEKVSQFRCRRDEPVLHRMRDQLAVWAQAHIEELTALEPDMPVEDRAADTWEPLVAVADIAGGRWPALARAACLAMVEGADDADEERSLDIKLLGDIRQIFAEKETAFLTSFDLLTELRALDESPWRDFDYTVRKLAHRLEPYGIKPGHNTEKTKRGYRLESFADAFARYLRPEPSEASSGQAR